MYRFGLLLIIACFIFIARGIPVESRTNSTAESYIVTFKDNVKKIQRNDIMAILANSIRWKYTKVFQGFAASLDESQVEMLSKNSAIESLERDGVVKAMGRDGCVDYPNAGDNSWGLGRVSSLSCDDKSSGLIIPDAEGEGVIAYVFDTGIRATHNDFTGRVEFPYRPSVNCFTAFNDEHVCGDCNGHGTFMASVVGGKDYGIAKKASLVSVRVLSCFGSGSTSNIIAGIEWVEEHCKNSGKKCVIGMAIGGSANTAIDNAVNYARSRGIFVSVASGNSGSDACDFSPARAEGAFTVSSIDINDERVASYGKCINIFAPGRMITAAWFGSDDEVTTISGTSAAAAHASGVAAASWGNELSWDVEKLVDHLNNVALKGCVKNPGPESPNSLLTLVCEQR